MSEKKRMRFPVLATLLLAGTFICGSATGMFLYATGENVITSTFMQMVSHTEYRYGEPGQIVARLVDFQGAPVVVNNCTADIKYPDKTAFVTAQLMTTSTITGDHYINFTTPSGPEGVYEYQATCFYNVGINVRNQSVTNSFHLSSAFTNIMANQTAQNAQLTAIQGNLTVVQTTLNGVSVNLTAINTSLSNQLNTNVTTILTQLAAVNTSITNQLNTNISSWNSVV